MSLENQLRLGGQVPVSELEKMDVSVGVLIQFVTFYPKEEDDIEEIFTVLRYTDDEVADFVGNTILTRDNVQRLAHEFVEATCKEEFAMISVEEAM